MTRGKTPAIERARKYFSEGAPDECWPWVGYQNPSGYGGIHNNGRCILAHRVVFEAYNGPIPVGLHVDHTCHNRAGDCLGGPTCPHRRCVNPAHLEATTNAENVRRGAAARSAARGVQFVACSHGERVYGEICRGCARDRAAKQRRDQKTGLKPILHADCATCGEYKRVMARGMCNACYLRQYRAKKERSDRRQVA